MANGLDLMAAIRQLDQDRQTLMVEIGAIWTLVNTALTRLERITAAVSTGEHAATLAPMWADAMTGREGEAALTVEDIGGLVVKGSEVRAIIQALSDKRPIFPGVPTVAVEQGA